LKSNGWNVFRVRNNSSGAVGAYIEVRGITMRGHSYVDANGDRQIKAAYEPYIGLTDSRTNGNGFGVDGGYHPTNFPHNLRVADCLMEYLAGSNGGSADRQTFENNIIRYNAWWMKYAGSGISFGFARDAETGANYRRLIRNNIVYGNECMVPWRRSTSNPYSDGNGIIMDSDPAGYTGKTLILNNLVYNNGGSGIHVLKVSNVDIIHNTVYHNSASSSQAYGQIFTQSFSSTAGQWVKNVNVTNNIMVAQKRDGSTTNSYLFNEAATSVASSDPTTIFHKRNVYVGGDNTPSLSGANLSDNTDRGRSYDPALIFVSPSIDPAAADFRLRSAAATNYGATVGYRSIRDLANNPRSLTGATDTGAYQTISAVAFSPIFTPKAGNYSATQNVVLTSDTAAATLVYTTNGTDPTVDALGVPTNGTLYTAAISVTAATTLKAIAWKSGLTASPVSNAPYTFQNLTSLPVTLSVQTPTGIYSGTQYSQPLTRTPGALFRYTTNGTDPTYNVTTPSASTGIPQDYRGVTVLDYATLRYQAYKPGRANSAIVATNITVRASFGNSTDGSALTSFGAGNIRFVRFHPTSYFSAAYIFARINGLTGNYRAAIYSETSGAPSTRLAASSAVTNPATGWVAFPLSSRVSLSVKDSSNADQYYWLAIWSDNAAAGIYATTTGGTVRELALAYPATWASATTHWPTPADTSTTVAGTANYAIYATNSPPNLAPVVNAGTDQNALGGATVTLNGSVADDGVPAAAGTVTQTWSMVSGPGTVTFANPASAATTTTYSATGTYVLRLTARDALATATDDVTIVTGIGGISLDASPPPGVVRARFSDAVGTSPFPQHYPGAAGDGWAAAWVASGTTPAPNGSVASTSPLNAGGNYLTVARNGGSGSGLAGVYRQWATSATTGRPEDQFSRLTFDLRVEPTALFTAVNDNINITARPIAGATSGADSTFFIRAFGGAPTTVPANRIQAREWCVYNGDVLNNPVGGYDANDFLPTDLECIPGDTYGFTINLYGAAAAGSTAGKMHGTYDVTITNRRTLQTATKTGVRFRSLAYLTGSYLSFAMGQDTATDNLAFSVDSIEMTGLTVMDPVTSSVDPADSGELVTFTATVASSGGSLPPVIPTGTVTFLDGATVLGTGTLDASGEATFNTSALDPGLHSITASYAATASYTGSTSASPALVQNVLSATTLTLSSNVNPAILGDAVTFTATVDGETGNPTGTVTFLDGAVVLGTVSVNASAVASLSTSTLSVGLHPVTARYNGDAINSTSVSGILDLVVRNATTTALVSSANPAAVGNPAIFTAIVTGGTPAGIVTFFDGVEI
ncbi:Ig-like domain repeat protein, partial [bacterium]|nr:Ig-like domain repeat protein [bacterium]